MMAGCWFSRHCSSGVRTGVTVAKRRQRHGPRRPGQRRRGGPAAGGRRLGRQQDPLPQRTRSASKRPVPKRSASG